MKIKRLNIIDMVEKLNPPKLDINLDLKKEFYESQSNKYGLNIKTAITKFTR